MSGCRCCSLELCAIIHKFSESQLTPIWIENWTVLVGCLSLILIHNQIDSLVVSCYKLISCIFDPLSNMHRFSNIQCGICTKRFSISMHSISMAALWMVSNLLNDSWKWAKPGAWKCIKPVGSRKPLLYWNIQTHKSTIAIFSFIFCVNAPAMDDDDACFSTWSISQQP